MTARTKDNLVKAMETEALSHAMYTRFAATARLNEENDLAQLFQDTADIDRIQHFRREFDFANSPFDDRTNLEACVADKRRQVDMYTQFAAEAAADGDLEAAALFRTVAEDEVARAYMFQAMLENLSGSRARAGRSKPPAEVQGQSPRPN